MFTAAQTQLKSQAQELTEAIDVHAGAGNIYGGGVGAAAEYQNKVREKLWIAPFAGLSWLQTDMENRVHFLGYCGGVSVEYGNTNKLLARFSYGTQSAIYETTFLAADRTAVRFHNARLLYGPALCIGYKRVWDKGIIWHVSMGTSALLNANLTGEKRVEYGPTFSVGVGYRFRLKPEKL